MISALSPFVFVAFPLGILGWTFAEYMMHRFLGHDRRIAHSRANFFVAEHTRHHSVGNYFAPSWKKALLVTLVVPPALALASPFIAVDVAGAFFAGFLGMYALYEAVHRRAHTHRGLGAYGAFLRRHHFHHHFHNPQTNHGVTSPIWDWAFGTLVAPKRIRVPKKLCMAWLVDPATNDVWADLADRYELS